MTARLESAAAAPLSWARQWSGIADDEKPAKTLQKRPAKPKATVQPAPARRALTPADILAAANLRLSGMPAADIESLTGLIAPLTGDWREDHPDIQAIINDWRFADCQHDRWLLLSAVVARDAFNRGDVMTLYSAGAELVLALREIASRDRSPLTALMRDFKFGNPHLTAEQAFEEFVRLGQSGCHPVIAGYSALIDTLELLSGKVVTRETFCRQYRRL